MDNESRKCIRIVLIAVPIVVTAVLVYRFFAPFGAEVRYTYSLKNDPEVISQLKPIDRTNFLIKAGEDYFQIPELVMKNDIVRFSVKLPIRGFKRAEVRMRFKNNSNELKIGLRGNSRSDYQYRALDNKILDNLGWSKIREGNLVFWQKHKNYNSIQELIDKPLKNQVIAQYLYDINDDFRIKDYKKSNKEFVVDCPLRGSHTIYTYIKDEPLDFIIEKQDQNYYKGKDKLEINVWKGKDRVYTQTIGDDGITDDIGYSKKQPQVAHIYIPNLKGGVYKIELVSKSAGNDFLITKIVTRQHLLVFAKKIFIVGDKPVTIWTNSKMADFFTFHSESLQTLRINDVKNLEITKRNSVFNASMNKDLNKIYSPKSDVIITSDGYYSFTPESFFNPRPYNTIELTNDVNLDDVDYVIANYSKPKNINGWLEKDVDFDISNTKITNDTLQFVLKSPGLRENNAEVIIDNLEIILKK